MELEINWRLCQCSPVILLCSAREVELLLPSTPVRPKHQELIPSQGSMLEGGAMTLPLDHPWWVGRVGCVPFRCAVWVWK